MQRWLRLLFLLEVALLCGGQRFNPARQRQVASCSTPNSEQGTCINIKQCDPLLNLLKNQRNKPEVVTFLRNSVCGYERSDPKVCCPSKAEGSPVAPPKPAGEPSVPSPPNCGVSQASDRVKIIGGKPADLGAWPWIGAIGYRSSTRPGPIWNCAGTLVNNRYMVTAAHCNEVPKQSMYMVRLGDLDLNETVNDKASPIDVRIEKLITNPSYNRKTRTGDIALIRLQESVPFSNYIQPICLPTAPQLRANKFVKYFPFVAGWGRTSTGGPSSTALQELQLPVVDNDSCNRSYANKKAEIVPSQLCAGFPRGGKDSCQGDSGGPLMLPQGSSFYLIGVVSYGYKCAEPGYPGIYTRVTDFVDWIEETMN